MKENYDVLIIGAGVIGSAVARELSAYDCSVLVVDRESDICEGTSKANSGIVHGGFDAKPGSLKALLNVRGNKMMGDVAEELDVPFRRVGAMVIARGEGDMPALEKLYSHGIQNGVEGLEIIDGDKAREMEPGLTDEVTAALYVPSSGIVCPFELTQAFAENAAANGVRFLLDTEVKDISRASKGFSVETSSGTFGARCVVNCAGVYADRIHDMVCSHAFSITARKGEYMLLDKSAGGTVSRTIFQTPTPMGKGVLVSPTVHGNLLVGPTAYDIEDKEDISTTPAGIGTVREKSALSVKDIPLKKVITSFSGLRATGDTGDFYIKEDDDVKGFVDVACMESPGLSSAPAAGLYVRDIVLGIIDADKKADWQPRRKGIPKLASMDPEERQALIAERPEYGHIVCRCEEISEGEILDAIRRPLGATTTDGVKRRVRAGMGRCQGGFCSPKVTALLAKELGVGLLDVKRK